MTLSLDQKCEDLCERFNLARRRHMKSEPLRKELMKLRVRAMRATVRRKRAESELPLFRSAA